MTRRLRAEVWIVLGLSLGQSAVYSVASLARKLSEGPLRDSTATLNPSRDTVPWLDLTYQLLSIGFALVPVALALYLLSLDDAPPVLRRLGLDGSRPWRDLGFGAALAAVIGIPGLGVYFGGRALGVTANIVTSPEDLYWWSVTILVLSALQNALLEEVIVVGYLMTRLKQFGWGLPAIIATSALLRGSYHLYQGFGQFVGNVAMGVVFAWWFHRTGRVMPLVIAHTILDVVAFVGYALFADAIGLR
ncbi:MULTISPECIES: CPBP family intramembrane glutamic endopeptidase [Aeromicrobium]|uniref:CPBP family intramembrane glutamic endopeptidase n=1 Tax=Aeromicrobium TaxID=2040 RepID=UPI00257CE149|nr:MULTISPECIES: CPBP family intramembrane glutamic endopeptidase [Aeromicrobium]